ncbi:MAG: hypothetical protein HC767_09640 [Akkermansiaceae bacterium]|nr:hypothetical protein [Akkermansiaceae bacterium]
MGFDEFILFLDFATCSRASSRIAMVARFILSPGVTNCLAGKMYDF